METTPEGVSRIQVKKLFGNAAGVLLVSTLLASCSRSDSNPAVVSGTIDSDEVHVASRYGLSSTAAGSSESSKIYRPGTTWPNNAAPEKNTQRIVFIADIFHSGTLPPARLTCGGRPPPVHLLTR